MAFPGTPVGHLFGPRQRMGNTIPQVMSPNAPAFANPPGFALVYAIPELEASFALVTDRIHYQSGQEELTAQRVTLEANLQQEYRDRELLLCDELVELHFAHYMSRQAQAELQTWEEQQRELYETRFRALGHEMHQHFAQQELNQEALSLRYFRDLEVELEQAEAAHRAMVQQEARAFAQDLHQELDYHMTSNAQAQSLLTAERALHEESLDSHTARWQQALDMTTKGAEEEIEQERTQKVELALNLNDLRLQLQEAEVQLKEWDDWYDSGVFAPTEEKEAGEEEETGAASQAASLPPAPVTPAVLHNPVLSSRHLPSANSLVRFAESSSEKENEVETEQEEAQATAARALQDWESQKEFELREALARISQLESSEARMGGVAPSLPHYNGLSYWRCVFSTDHRPAKSLHPRICQQRSLGLHQREASADFCFAPSTFTTARWNAWLHRSTFSCCT